MHIEHHNMIQQDFHHFYYYTADTQPHVNLQPSWDMICCTKLAMFHDFVHTSLTQAAYSQKSYYDQHTKQFTFAPGG